MASKSGRLVPRFSSELILICRKTKEGDIEADAPILIIAGSDTSSVTST
jgi:hypothetical protein